MQKIGKHVSFQNHKIGIYQNKYFFFPSQIYSNRYILKYEAQGLCR